MDEPKQKQSSSEPAVPQGKVFLGGGVPVRHTKIEEIVKADEGLRWKVDNILHCMFRDEDLLISWLQVPKDKKSFGKTLPHKVVTGITNIINEVNRKLVERRIVLETARLREKNKNRSEEAIQEAIQLLEAKALEGVDNCTEKMVSSHTSHLLDAKRKKKEKELAKTQPSAPPEGSDVKATEESADGPEAKRARRDSDIEANVEKAAEPEILPRSSSDI